MGQGQERADLRAAGALATAAASIPELERQIAIKENQISVLLGNNPSPVPHTAKLLEQVVPPDVPAGLPSALLERRPDILTAEQQLRSANLRSGALPATLPAPSIKVGPLERRSAKASHSGNKRNFNTSKPLKLLSRMYRTPWFRARNTKPFATSRRGLSRLTKNL